MKRFGQVIKIKPEKLDYYKALHANPWPEVIERLKNSNIQNYSIYLFNDEFLFAYFEYTGNNFDVDMEKIAADPITQRWWQETDPCQISLIHTDGRPQWQNMEEIFHMD